MNILGTILKARKGEASMEELLEVLSVAGIDAKVKPVTPALARDLLGAAPPASKLFVLDGKTKEGGSLVAIMVLPA